MTKQRRHLVRVAFSSKVLSVKLALLPLAPPTPLLPSALSWTLVPGTKAKGESTRAKASRRLSRAMVSEES